jgi:hypothetical protein
VAVRAFGVVPAAVVLTALVIFVTWPQAAHLATGVSDFGDSLLNAWALAWVAHAVATRPASLFDANIFHPEAGTLAYSETLLLPGLILAPVLWLGADPILVHNLLLLGACIASGVTMFVLVRALTGHAGAALVAGAVFALAPYRMEIYAKVQLQLTWWWPLALLALHRVASAPSRRNALALGLLVAAEAYTCLYYGIFGGIGVGVVACVLLVTLRGRRGHVLGALAVAAGIALLAVAPLAMVYGTASRTVGERSLDDVRRGSALPGDYLRAHPEGWLHGDPKHPGDGERRLFPGFAAPVLAAAALVPPIDVAVIGYLALAGTAFDLSLGVNGPGFQSLYDRVWPLRALRVVARFAMLVALATAVLAGFGVARLCRGRPASLQIALVVIALAAVTAEGRMQPVALSFLPDRAPAVYSWLAGQPPGVVCEYPVNHLEGRLGPQDPTYMYYSTRHWQPLLNGYSGFAPPSYLELLDRVGDFPDDASVNYLRARGVRYLLVHGVFYIDGDFNADVERLRSRSDVRFIGVFPWRGGGQSAVFVLDP